MAASISPAEIARLAKSIEDLGHRSEHLRTALYVCTAFVVVGLAIEYWKEFRHLAKLAWAYTMGRVPFEWWRLWTASVAIGGGLLVTIGVGGELVTEFFASHVDSELASDNAKLVGDLDKLAEDASDKAREALTDSGTAITQSAAAKGTASNAMTLARDTRREADSFEQDIISAKTQAADAVARLLNRSISVTQRREILSQFGTANIRVQIKFNSTIGNGEAKAYADELANVLKAAGASVTPSEGLMGNASITGVLVCANARATSNITAAALALCDLLIASGIPDVNQMQGQTFRCQSGDDLTSVWITVGQKPLPHP
jgi:hypothetical protein